MTDDAANSILCGNREAHEPFDFDAYFAKEIADLKRLVRYWHDQLAATCKLTGANVRDVEKMLEAANPELARLNREVMRRGR
jgi:hypothetical protein